MQYINIETHVFMISYDDINFKHIPSSILHSINVISARKHIYVLFFSPTVDPVWVAILILTLTTILLSSQSLCGCSVTVSTIDGKTCNMKITDVIKPGMRKTVAGQGLPFPKNPEQRGDLVVEFDVNFPDTLPGNAKDVLKRHLPT